MRESDENASASLNCTYELETTSVLIQAPGFAASSPNDLSDRDLVPSPIKKASCENATNTPDLRHCSTPQSLCTSEPKSLKSSLEDHFVPLQARRNILSAPRSVHRGPVKNKTVQGSAERSCLLQALRASHLERNEFVLDNIICHSSADCSVMKQSPFEKHTHLDSQLRQLPNSVIPLHRVAANQSTTSPKIATPFRSVIRTGKYGGVRERIPARTFGIPVVASCSLTHTSQAETPIIPNSAPMQKSRLATDTAAQNQTVKGAARQQLCTPFSPATPFRSVIRTSKYGGRRDRSPLTKTEQNLMKPRNLYITSPQTAIKLVDSPGSMTRGRLRELLRSSYLSAAERALNGTASIHSPQVSNRAHNSKNLSKKKVSFMT